MLYTPQQTFSSLVVWPTDDRSELAPPAQELWDGFFLVPLEREGKVRTGHKLVKRLEISLTEEGHLRAFGHDCQNRPRHVESGWNGTSPGVTVGSGARRPGTANQVRQGRCR